MKFHLFLIVSVYLSTVSLVIRTVECLEATQQHQQDNNSNSNSNSNSNNNNNKSWYSNLSVVIHHNGEVDPCGSIGRKWINDDFIRTLTVPTNQYEMETRLTNGLESLLFLENKDVGVNNDDKDASMGCCGQQARGGDGSDYAGDNDSDQSEYHQQYYQSLYSHCDRGPEKTPVLLDHHELIRTEIGTLPCRFYTREGLRIQTLEDLKTMAEKARHRVLLLAQQPSQQVCKANNTAHCGGGGNDASEKKHCEPNNDDDDCSYSSSPEIHLYAVPAGRLFHFAPAFVGELFKLDHISLLPDASKPIVLEVLATRPKIFDILNVFTKEEADAVVQRALAETSPTYRIKRSTTSGTSGGSDGNVYSKRTSENGFDTSGEVATALKQRIFEVLGYDEYWGSHGDGLQVLRYNLTTAYIPHMDYLAVSKNKDFEYDYDSSQIGGNRYATVLLYMTDIPDNGGGETVFKKIWPFDGTKQARVDALKALRASGDADRAGIVRDSWEEEMVADCRRHFSVKPYSGRAILFYSQHPNGEEDKMALHGGCPVLEGDKWAANLWVWNAPRQGHKGAPMKEGIGERPKTTNAGQLHAIFRNSGNDESMKDAELYYDEAMFWGKLIPGGPPLSSSTYEGHRWNVKVDGKIVKRWVIGRDAEQEFVI